MLAALGGRVTVVDVLLRAGANPKIRSWKGLTARQLAEQSFALSPAILHQLCALLVDLPSEEGDLPHPDHLLLTSRRRQSTWT